MQAEELYKLVEKIRKYNCEFQTIEVKAANINCPTKLFNTLSSFSNQDSGGIIVFGLDEKTNFDIVGVYDVQDLQKKVNEQCKQMEPLVRPLFTVCDIEGKLIVSAEIPSVDVSDRPVFYKGVGRIKGSYIRVGDSNELMSEYEIYSYDAFRRRIRDDLRVINTAKVSLFNNELFDKYLLAVKKERRNIASNATDEEIMELMGVTIDGIPTLSGIMAFSKYPQAYFPQLCITAVVVPGTQIGDVGSDGERFIANQRITGTVSDMLEEALAFIRRNSRIKTIVNEEGKRADKSEFPMKAIREAVLNSLMHRDYSYHTEGTPIRICMYSDRMEIINSGGLYGRISIDSLGKVHPETRNPSLANIMELLGIIENRYSGIPTIRREMKEAGLPEPIFSVKRGEFIVVFKNDIEYAVNKATQAYKRHEGDIRKEVLKFCETPRSREELIHFTGFTRYYMMKTIVNPMLASGMLMMTIPAKPKSVKQKYYSNIDI